MAKFVDPPARTPFFGEKDQTTPIYPWMRWFQDVAQRLTSPATTAPTSATSAGIVGQIAFDANFIYVAVGTNTWKRAALSSF